MKKSVIAFFMLGFLTANAQKIENETTPKANENKKNGME